MRINEMTHFNRRRNMIVYSLESISRDKKVSAWVNDCILYCNTCQISLNHVLKLCVRCCFKNFYLRKEIVQEIQVWIKKIVHGF